MLKHRERLRRVMRDVLLSPFARTTWLTFLLILVYAVALRAGLLG
jgi:hypothetical protein